VVAGLDLDRAVAAEVLDLDVVVRRPVCSMSREPLREEYTTCTARAPEAVFTVRT
jgi:hypothetical protein